MQYQVNTTIAGTGRGLSKLDVLIAPFCPTMIGFMIFRIDRVSRLRNYHSVSKCKYIYYINIESQ